VNTDERSVRSSSRGLTTLGGLKPGGASAPPKNRRLAKARVSVRRNGGTANVGPFVKYVQVIDGPTTASTTYSRLYKD
jgi:hypothetical protein